jgi:DNA repair exonuclease SbcCD ATPase subunit
MFFDYFVFLVFLVDFFGCCCTVGFGFFGRVSVQKNKKQHDQVVAYGTGVCGSCGQKLPGDTDIDKLTADLKLAEDNHSSLEDDYLEARNKLNEYDVAKRQYFITNNKAELLFNQTNTNLSKMQDMSDFDEDVHAKQVEAHSLNASHQKSKMDEQSMMDFHKGSLGKLDVEIATLEASDTVTPETQASARAMITAFESAEETVNQLNKEVELNKAYVTTSESRLETFQEDMRNGAANIATKDLLSQARDKLHVEQLPRLAAQSSIQAINRAMKKYLDMFAFPYGFRLNEKLDFVVDFDSSIDHSAEILSGGEEVRAAMAMRFALMDVFSAGCGVLIIDEPTTALDKEAIGALIEVLETASTYFKSRNIKIICPTHDQQLAAISDSLITIGEVA